MSRERGWRDDGVTLFGRSFERTEHVFGGAAFAFLLLVVCSVLSLAGVAAVTQSPSPTGTLGFVATTAFVGLLAAAAGLGGTFVCFGCWSYWQSRRMRATLDAPAQTPLGNPAWFVFVVSSSKDALNEYEWWVRRAVWWAAFGTVWLLPVAKVALDGLGLPVGS